MKNIILVGFMGTGKTEIAKALSRELGKPYVSIDDMIVKKEGRPITDIFGDDGEAYFRSVEKEIVKEVSSRSDQIVDTGGGVVLDEENIDALRSGGTIICLWADAAVIYERTRHHGHRPLLNVEDPEAKINELLDFRRPYYEKADVHIDTSKLDIDDVVSRIRRAVNE